MNRDKLTSEECAEQYRKLLRGEVEIRLVDPKLTWDYVWCGNFECMVGDWRFVIFNDCGELDYTDHVYAPDGREADYDQFYEEGDPVDMVGEDREGLEAILESAK